MAGDLVNTLADLKEKEALRIVEDRLNAGKDAMVDVSLAERWTGA